MTRLLASALFLALAACSDDPPPAKPAAKPAPPAPPGETPHPPGEAKAPPAPQPPTQHELAQRVKQALEGEAKVQAAAIDVTAAEGRVTLWGTAATAGERNRAGQVASKVDGVKSVDNQLKVVKGS